MLCSRPKINWKEKKIKIKQNNKTNKVIGGLLVIMDKKLKNVRKIKNLENENLWY